MTGRANQPVPAEKIGGWRWWLSSMWGFWLLLLAVSLGAAAVIYYVWLAGRL